jgi:tRNA threonylcarbamoyladenosine biosynthesis protein TsaB
MELSIDSAGDRASVAVSDRGELVAELTWRCQANHSVELLPAVDRILALAHTDRVDLEAIFVCRGPGSYGGLRAGLSLGMALADGLRIAILGVGRFEVEAYQQAGHSGPVCPVHRAGRGELAWAAYEVRNDDLREVAPPQLCWPPELPERAPAGALYCGEIDAELWGLLRAADPAVAIAGPHASLRRAGALSELGWRRYASGARSEGGFVEPLYLREPQITVSQKNRLQG